MTLMWPPSPYDFWWQHWVRHLYARVVEGGLDEVPRRWLVAVWVGGGAGGATAGKSWGPARNRGNAPWGSWQSPWRRWRGLCTGGGGVTAREGRERRGREKEREEKCCLRQTILDGLHSKKARYILQIRRRVGWILNNLERKYDSNRPTF